MTVAPTSDVVLDVLHAADPEAHRAATARLAALKKTDGNFPATMQAQADGSEAAMQGKGVTQSVRPGRPVEVAPAQDAYRRFEAFVLQVFVESMLPQNAQDVFGKGTAGSVWRSMLAEQLGNQLARGNGIGIARQLGITHPVSSEIGPGTSS